MPLFGEEATAFFATKDNILTFLAACPVLLGGKLELQRLTPASLGPQVTIAERVGMVL